LGKSLGETEQTQKQKNLELHRSVQSSHFLLIECFFKEKLNVYQVKIGADRHGSRFGAKALAPKLNAPKSVFQTKLNFFSGKISFKNLYSLNLFIICSLEIVSETEFSSMLFVSN